MQITLNLRALLPSDRFRADGADLRMTRLVPLQMRRRGVETRLVLPGEAAAALRIDPALLRALARGYQCSRTGGGNCGVDQADRRPRGVSDSYVRQCRAARAARSSDRGRWHLLQAEASAFRRASGSTQAGVPIHGTPSSGLCGFRDRGSFASEFFDNLISRTEKREGAIGQNPLVAPNLF